MNNLYYFLNFSTESKVKCRRGVTYECSGGAFLVPMPVTPLEDMSSSSDSENQNPTQHTMLDHSSSFSCLGN